MLQLTRPLIWLDVETHDKVPPEHAHICEIGFKIIYPPSAEDPNKIIEPKRWVSYIKPPVPISEGATGVHNITNEMVAGSPTWEQVGPNIAKGFVDCDFGGYNPFFDLRVIYASMLRIGVKWDYEGAHVVDGLRIWQVAKPRTLSDAVREFCAREPREAHRALGDAEDAEEATYGMLTRFDHIPRSPKELHDLCFAKDPSRVDRDGKIVWSGSEAALGFGKHSGTLLKNVPRGYLEWILGGTFAPDTKRIVEDALNGKYPQKEVTTL